MPFHENLKSLRYKAVLLSPLQTKAIAAARVKNDKVDSRVLANLLRTNYLPSADPSGCAEQLLMLLLREAGTTIE